jgi:hypothetical protein
MSHRHKRHRNAVAKFDAVAPITTFGGDCRIVIAHDDVLAKRCDHARPVRGREPRQRGDVEMIVMAMRYQHGVDRRQVGKGDTRIVDTLRPETEERRGAGRPDRVQQHVQAGRLDEETGVADIGHA